MPTLHGDVLDDAFNAAASGMTADDPLPEGSPVGVTPPEDAIGEVAPGAVEDGEEVAAELEPPVDRAADPPHRAHASGRDSHPFVPPGHWASAGAEHAPGGARIGDGDGLGGSDGLGSVTWDAPGEPHDQDPFGATRQAGHGSDAPLIDHPAHGRWAGPEADGFGHGGAGHHGAENGGDQAANTDHARFDDIEDDAVEDG